MLKKKLVRFRNFISKSNHRVILEKEIIKKFNQLNKYNNKSTLVVDFGSGIPRYTELMPNARWKFFDKAPISNKVIYSDINKIPIDNADIFLCIEMVEYLDINQINIFIKESKRIINKKKGYIILSVPYLCPIDHNELIRIADKEIIARKFSNKYNLETIAFGNLMTIIHDALLITIKKIILKINKNDYYNLNKKIKFIIMMLLLPIKISSLIFRKIGIFDITSGLIFIIKSNK